MRLVRGQRSSPGQSLVEFALALPVFLLIMLAVAEGGYYVAASTAVSHATHEGARLGVLESTDTANAVRGRVKDAAAVLVGVADSDISFELNGSACDDTCFTGRASGDRLGVITRYTHVPLIGYVFDGISFAADASAELLVE